MTFPDEAEARRENVWSVKFKCSIDSVTLNPYDESLEKIPYSGKDVTGVAVQTWVNIHNPTNKTVLFNKKVVIVEPQHQNATTEISGKEGIELDPNEAHSVDCEDIVDILAGPELATPVIDPTDFVVGDFNTPNEGIFEGFVVIESESGRKIPDLVVCANYSTYMFETRFDTVATAVDTECFKPIRVKVEGKFQLF